MTWHILVCVHLFIYLLPLEAKLHISRDLICLVPFSTAKYLVCTQLILTEWMTWESLLRAAFCKSCTWSRYVRVWLGWVMVAGYLKRQKIQSLFSFTFLFPHIIAGLKLKMLMNDYYQIFKNIMLSILGVLLLHHWSNFLCLPLSFFPEAKAELRPACNPNPACNNNY